MRGYAAVNKQCDGGGGNHDVALSIINKQEQSS